MPTPEANAGVSNTVQGTVPTPVEIPRPVNTIPNALAGGQDINISGVPVPNAVEPIPNVTPVSSSVGSVQPSMPTFNTSGLENQPVMPNIIPSQSVNNYNIATSNQTNNGISNPNLVAGSANFVVGTPVTQNNQVPNDNGNNNWNL